MIKKTNILNQFITNLDRLHLNEASDLLQLKEGEEIVEELRSVATSSPDRLFQERATIELALRLSESLIYRGKARDAYELLQPYTENTTEFVNVSRGIHMRWRLQVGECLYSQRNRSTDYLPRAQEVARALLSSCRDQNRNLEEGQVYYFCMRLEHRKGNYDQMGTQAMKAIDAITQSDTQPSGGFDMAMHSSEVPWWIGRTLLEYGIAAWRHGESERAAARLQLAKWLLRYVPGDTLNHARVNHSIGSLYHAQGKMDEAKNLLEEAKSIYSHLGHTLNLSRINCAIGRYWLSLNQYEGAAKHFEEAWGQADKFGSAMQLAEVYVWKGWRRCEQEVSAPELDQAIEEGVKALGLLEGTQGHHIYVDAHLMMGHSCLKKGEAGRAEAHFEKALKTAREHRLQKHVLNALLSLGEVARERKNLREAMGHYRNAMNGFPDGKLPFSQYLEKKAETLRAWLYSNDLEVFMRTAEDVRGGTGKTLEAYRSEFDRWLVGQIYEAEGKHVGDAAKRLGISRQRMSTILEQNKVRDRRKYQEVPEGTDRKKGSQKRARRRGA